MAFVACTKSIKTIVDLAYITLMLLHCV